MNISKISFSGIYSIKTPDIQKARLTQDKLMKRDGPRMVDCKGNEVLHITGQDARDYDNISRVISFSNERTQELNKAFRQRAIQIDFSNPELYK